MKNIHQVSDLCGAESIIRDVPVYDAALIDEGEFLMLGATDPDSGADHGVAFVTGYTGASTEMVDGLGISMEKRDTTSTPSVAGLPDAGDNFSKATVNPFAVYRIEYDLTTTITVASTSSTTITVTSLEDDIDCGWIYIVAGGTGASGNAGSLRFLTASAAGSATMSSALPTTETGGNATAIKILPKNHRLSELNTTGTKLLSQAAVGDGISLMILENYIGADSIACELLRYATHRNLNGLTGVKLFADVILIDHVYNPNV